MLGGVGFEVRRFIFSPSNKNVSRRGGDVGRKKKKKHTRKRFHSNVLVVTASKQKWGIAFVVKMHEENIQTSGVFCQLID